MLDTVAAWRRVAGVVICLKLLTGAPAEEKFKARLSPVPADAAMRADIAGSGSATAALVGAKLSITGSFDGLRTPATVARLHEGPVTGVRGAPLGDLTVSKSSSGKITGSFDLTTAQVESLRKGRLYIQIHSEKAAGGNLWGWLLQ